MQDKPDAAVLLESVVAFLRDTAIPNLPAREAFEARVAAGALELVQRDLALRRGFEDAERSRLEAILGRTGTLADLNPEFAQRLRDGSIDPAAPEVAEHLWATALEKLAVDQPRYAAYVRALDASGPLAGEN